MLNKVEVINSQGDVLSLPLGETVGGVTLQGMEGLEPVPATLVSSSFANMDGAQYHSSRREPRNMKLQLGFDPDFEVNTVRVIRNNLYNFFMPKTEVKIRFYIFDEFDTNIITQNHIWEIVGRVEGFVSPPFSQEPVVDISLICFDPDFVDTIPGSFSGMSTAGLTETTLDYDGTVENGLLFTFSPNRTVDSFTIYHRPPDGTLRTLDFTEALLSGDILKISTTVGSKSVIRTRAGVDSSKLYAMTPQSNWLELQPGPNVFRVYAVGAGVPFTISYTVKHGGL